MKNFIFLILLFLSTSPVFSASNDGSGNKAGNDGSGDKLFSYFQCIEDVKAGNDGSGGKAGNDGSGGKAGNDGSGGKSFLNDQCMAIYSALRK